MKLFLKTVYCRIYPALIAQCSRWKLMQIENRLSGVWYYFLTLLISQLLSMLSWKKKNIIHQLE